MVFFIIGLYLIWIETLKFSVLPVDEDKVDRCPQYARLCTYITHMFSCFVQMLY